MAYDSRTDRKKVTWEKKTERTRKHREQQRADRWEGSRNTTRSWREFA